MARSRSIGNIYAELSVKDKMTAGLNRAEKSLKKFGSSVLSMGANFAAMMPAAAIAGGTYAIKQAIDAGGQLSDMMARTGAAGEGLFVMQRAFENAGIAGSKVPSVLNKIQKTLAGVNEQGEQTKTRVFDDLGLSLEKLRSMDAAEAFRTISESIAKIPDPAERSALAMEIFGKSGGELLAVMNDVAAFDIAEKQVGKLGKFLTDNAESLDKIGDSLSIFGSKVVEVGAVLAVELMPQLESFSNWMTDLDLVSITKEFGGLSEKISELAGNFMSLVKLTPAFQLGNFLQNSDIPESERARILAERDKSIADYVPTTASGTGSLASPEFQKSMDSWMTGYLETFKAPTPVAGMTMEETGIPGVAAMLDAIMESVAPLAVEEAQAIGNAADFQGTQYDVNEMQRRGLGMGAESVAKKANDQVSLLEQIRDVLKNAKIQNKQLVWDV